MSCPSPAYISNRNLLEEIAPGFDPPMTITDGEPEIAGRKIGRILNAYDVHDLGLDAAFQFCLVEKSTHRDQWFIYPFAPDLSDLYAQIIPAVASLLFETFAA